jgi:hypothetical protein
MGSIVFVYNLPVRKYSETQMCVKTSEDLTITFLLSMSADLEFSLIYPKTILGPKKIYESKQKHNS